MKLAVTIDHKSGFCFGVVNAIEAVEENLGKHDHFYCLGDIVHNEKEIQRLSEKGLKVIYTKDIEEIKNSVVLIRAHGEPPHIYEQLTQQGNTIVDATCPIVLKLQKRVNKSWTEMKAVNGQTIIFGKKGHPEVIGLNGQTHNEATVVSGNDDLNSVDFKRPIRLYSQTTKSRDDYDALAAEIKQRMRKEAVSDDFVQYKTICGQVADRVPHLREFAPNFDVFIFVSGKNSSNGKYLFSIVQEVNDNAHFISSIKDIKSEWFSDGMKVGISGATSTPSWLLERVASFIQKR